MRRFGWPPMWQATGPAIALMLALGFAAIVKARLLSRLLDAPRIGVALAADLGGGGGGARRCRSSIRLPEWAELIVRHPGDPAAFGAVLWSRGFGHEDRELFRMRKADIEELSLPDPGDARTRRDRRLLLAGRSSALNAGSGASR